MTKESSEQKNIYETKKLLDVSDTNVTTERKKTFTHKRKQSMIRKRQQRKRAHKNQIHTKVKTIVRNKRLLTYSKNVGMPNHTKQEETKVIPIPNNFAYTTERQTLTSRLTQTKLEHMQRKMSLT